MPRLPGSDVRPRGRSVVRSSEGSVVRMTTTYSLSPTLDDREGWWCDVQLVDRLRRGDQPSFAALVRRHHRAMLQVAQFYVSSQAVAEEVVQDTWLGVVRGLHRFEGRSSLKTWIYQILVNRAKTRGERERHTVSFCALDGDGIGRNSEATASSGVLKTNDDAWREAIAEEVISKELGTRIRFAIAALRPPQRAVISLRIVEGWSAVDVCALLGLSEANQRVLLHRARRAVRQALLPYLVEDQDLAR